MEETFLFTQFFFFDRGNFSFFKTSIILYSWRQAVILAELLPEYISYFQNHIFISQIKSSNK